MRKLIFIDACMRPDSRTRMIAEPLIMELSKNYEIEPLKPNGFGTT